MNLNSSPTLAQMQALTSQADDEAGDHILWVDLDGDVHLSLLPEDLGPIGFESQQPTMRLRYETCGQGNGYVGSEAARDVALMNRQLKSLEKEWANRKPTGPSEYVDSW